MKKKEFLGLLLTLAVCGPHAGLFGQQLANAPSTVMLTAQINADQLPATGRRDAPVQAPSPTNLQAGGAEITGAADESGQYGGEIPTQLTLQQAEQIAIHNNPRVQVAQLLARAEHQVSRETRSAYLPQVYGGAVAAQADDGSRYTFDGLRSTRLLTHAGGGVTLDQMLYDFGHTENLIASSKLREKAQNAHALATRLDVVLVTDQAFYSALEAQALIRVAEQTVETRETTDRQIAVLTKNKLRSDLDEAMAEENVAQAQLLLLNAQTQYQESLNALTAVLGVDHPVHFNLVEVRMSVPPPPPDPDGIVQQALTQRPDLMALNYQQQAEKKFSRAQREQMLPTIATTGVVGGTPVRSDAYFNSSWFGAVGLTLKVPLFNGFLYSAQAEEAEDRARATRENLRDLRDRVVRDVRDACLESDAAYQKIAATEKFLRAANLGLDLAQSRYRLGLSSIVELSQAQLAQTQASMENVNARFEYELSLAALRYQAGSFP